MSSSLQIRRDSLKEIEESSHDNEKKLGYPKSIFFIVVTEFCERFSYYGMRAVLTIYMRNVLDFSDDFSTTIYHVFLLLCYGLPVFGGILADSYIGKYKTVLYFSFIYAIGNAVLTTASVTPLHLPIMPLSLFGLLLMAIGTGGIKPCVVALGGEQFILPKQEKTLKQFFSIFLFTISVGNMVSTVITPVLRRDINCFDEGTCYPLAFGVPGFLMIIAIGAFAAGKSMYTLKDVEENIFVRVVKCITFALKQKYNQTNNNDVGLTKKKSHWLEYARSKYDEQLISDTRGLLRVLVYYLPVPLFFSLYEQLGSRWTLLATKMNGRIGSYMIKPDQMQVANAILMFIFIPFFEIAVYPIFNKCNLLKRPLQKMVVGGFLAAISFTLAGLVETQIQATYTYLPSAHGVHHLNFINTLPCPIEIIESGAFEVQNLSHLKNINSSSIVINVEGEQNYVQSYVEFEKLHLRLLTHPSCSFQNELQTNLTLLEFGLQSIVISEYEGSLKIGPLLVPEDVGKSKEGNAKLRLIYFDSFPTNINETREMELVSKSAKITAVLNFNNYEEREKNSDFLYLNWTTFSSLEPDIYDLFFMLNNGSRVKIVEKAQVKTGGSYLIVLHNNSKSIEEHQFITLTAPNQVHMLWLLPQYILMAWAEVLFIVSGMEFSFTEAPESMKSVLQSCWHLANAFGNILVILVAQLSLDQKYEFFGFSVLMGIDTVILCLMAIGYTYVSEKSSPQTLTQTHVSKNSSSESKKEEESVL